MEGKVIKMIDKENLRNMKKVLKNRVRKGTMKKDVYRSVVRGFMESSLSELS
jgi:hypothetical protein